jgi:hypothetical protein
MLATGTTLLVLVVLVAEADDDVTIRARELWSTLFSEMQTVGVVFLAAEAAWRQ